MLDMFIVRLTESDFSLSDYCTAPSLAKLQSSDFVFTAGYKTKMQHSCIAESFISKIYLGAQLSWHWSGKFARSAPSSLGTTRLHYWNQNHSIHSICWSNTEGGRLCIDFSNRKKIIWPWHHSFQSNIWTDTGGSKVAWLLLWWQSHQWEWNLLWQKTVQKVSGVLVTTWRIYGK